MVLDRIFLRNYATIVSLFDLPPLRIGEVDLHRHDLSNNPPLSLSLSHSLITTRSCLIPPVSWTSS